MIDINKSREDSVVGDKTNESYWLNEDKQKLFNSTTGY